LDAQQVTEVPDPTENARRAARYKFSQNRIRKIVDGAPPLSDEQLAELAAIIQSGAGR
jgi:hypothetical protein